MWATGGGKTEIVWDENRKKKCHCAWNKIKDRDRDAPDSFKDPDLKSLGFGRIEFDVQEGHLMPYVRIPWKSKRSHGPKLSATAMSTLYYVENVWDLKRPKLLISVTGGAQDFPMNRAKENVLYKLMEAARHTSAWIITGGTEAGIMKYVGVCRMSRYKDCWFVGENKYFPNFVRRQAFWL